MSFVDANPNGLSAADVAAVVGNNGGGLGGWGGDGAWWLIVLFLFAFAGNGWGGYGNGNGGGFVAADMQRGFDQSAVMSGIAGLQTAVTTGFGNAEVSGTNRQMANMQQMFGMQTAIDGRLDTLAMNQQNCCCENRAQTADLKYTVANEAATTRAAIQAGNQSILDKLCQLEIDGIKQNYENRIAGMQNQIAQLTADLTAAKFTASQGAQTSRILADNSAQTTALEQYLNPTPVPAYVVQNPNCCTQNYGCGCGASNF